MPVVVISFPLTPTSSCKVLLLPNFIDRILKTRRGEINLLQGSKRKERDGRVSTSSDGVQSDGLVSGIEGQGSGVIRALHTSFQ